MWDWFINLLTAILDGIHAFCGDWGLSIIILTLIIRILLTPLQTKSIRSSVQMQILQPKMKEIQELYADDPMRQQQELRKIYSEHKFNPLGGCLPLFLQMPVFFALFSALKLLPAGASFYNIFPDLSAIVSQTVATIGPVAAWAYITADVLFGVLTLIPMVINMQNAQGGSQKSSLIMGVVMAGFMMWIGWGSVPVGVLLYYITSALWGVIQQVTITKHLTNKYKKEEEERLKNAPVQVNVVRKEAKPRPKKKAK